MCQRHPLFKERALTLTITNWTCFNISIYTDVGTQNNWINHPNLCFNNWPIILNFSLFYLELFISSMPCSEAQTYSASWDSFWNEILGSICRAINETVWQQIYSDAVWSDLIKDDHDLWPPPKYLLTYPFWNHCSANLGKAVGGDWKHLQRPGQGW